MWRFAIRNLGSRPLRSLLSLLGLTVAIVGMVSLFAVATGLRSMVDSTFGRIKGLAAMQPGAPIPLFSKLPAAWQQDLEAIPGVSVVAGEVWQRVNVVDGKLALNPRFFFGTDLVARQRVKHGVYSDEIVEGRFLELADRGTNHTVLSRQIAQEFKKQVGDTLRVNTHDLKIVGIYHTGSYILDSAIIMDIGTVRELTRFEPDSVSSFYIEPERLDDSNAVIERIREAFRGRKRPDGKATTATLGPSFIAPQDRVDEDLPLEVRSASEWSEKFDRFSGDLHIILTLMTSIGVSIAVLSIVNTMLMSVTERIVEFGILKANGWTRWNVLALITYESGTLGLAGGLLGTFCGWLVTLAVNAYWPNRMQLLATPGLMLFAVAFSTALGVLGGLYPAIWAMRMPPMSAIRRGM